MTTRFTSSTASWQPSVRPSTDRNARLLRDRHRRGLAGWTAVGPALVDSLLDDRRTAGKARQPGAPVRKWELTMALRRLAIEDARATHRDRDRQHVTDRLVQPV